MAAARPDGRARPHAAIIAPVPAVSSPPPASPSLAAAYRDCDAITRREGRNFAWGFIFLGAEQKRAMNALYAYARITDDLVDEEERPIAERAGRIEAWRAASALAFGGGDPSSCLDAAGLRPFHSPLVAMADTAARFDVPREELLLLVDGCRDDLRPTRYATWGDTLGYCRKVAVTVGMAMLPIFGNRDEAMKRAMESIGYAFQLTNILRDIPEDWNRGRVYLPMELLTGHGVPEGVLAAGPPSPPVKTLLKEFADRAEALYESALPLETGLRPGPARTMRAMHRIYRGILDAIRAQDYDVWSRRPRLTTARKVAILARTVLSPR